MKVEEKLSRGMKGTNRRQDWLKKKKEKERGEGIWGDGNVQCTA